jgi:hypothetical protein
MGSLILKEEKIGFDLKSFIDAMQLYFILILD